MLKGKIVSLISGLVIGGLICSGIAYTGKQNAENIKANADQMASTLQVAEKTTGDLKDKLKEVQEGAVSSIGEANSAIGSLKTDLSNSKTAIRGLTESLTKETIEHSYTKSQLGKTYDDLSTTQARLAATNGMIQKQANIATDLRAKLVEAQNQVRSFEGQVATLQTNLSNKGAENADIKAQLEAAKKSIADLTTKVADLTDNLKMADDQVNSLTKEKEELEAAATKAAGTVKKENDQTVASGQAEINRLQQELQKANDEIKAVDQYVAAKAGTVKAEDLVSGVKELLNFTMPTVNK